MGILSLPLPFPHEQVEGFWVQEDVSGSLWSTGWADGTPSNIGEPTADLEALKPAGMQTCLFCEALGA